jgi:nucleoside-diphosphate-sugar epimerase
LSRIAVTGASGFVARNLLPVLLAEGHEVRGLARSMPDAAHAGDVEFRQGDVRHDTRVAELIDGCSAVVHLAASFAGGDQTDDITVIGTENVVAACVSAGVKRLIFVSCQGADAAAHAPFHASKWRAEQVVRASGVPFTVLRPSLVLGRDDGVLQPLAAMIRSLPFIPVPGDGCARTQPIDVADLVRCIAACLEGDAVRDETVSVGGPVFLTFRQLADLVSGELGLLKPKLLLPRRMMPLAAGLVPQAARPLFAPARVAQFQQGVVASPGIVERTFHFEPANIVPGLAGYLA